MWFCKTAHRSAQSTLQSLRRLLSFCVLFCLLLVASTARAQNIEDEPIEDVVPAPLATQNAPAHEYHGEHEEEHHADEAPPQSTLTPSGSGAAAGDARVSMPMLMPIAWWQVWRSFEGADKGFLRNALAAGILVALLCGYLGLFIVLKRIVFVSVALSELSSAGIALALYFAVAPLLGAVAFTLLGIALFSLRPSPRRVPHDSYIGIIYCIAGALGILLIAKSAHGETHMLKLMQGDVLTVDPRETAQMAGVFAVVALLHALFSKEFILVSFDRDSASTLGFRASLWDGLLFLTIGFTIAFAIRATGVLLCTTMLILPAVAALLLTKRMRYAMLLAPLLGLLPLVLGLHFSLLFDLPASAVVVAISFVVLLPALLQFLIRRGD
ncbi:MAG: zinc/manganese transport system permease protein [Abditibacteriota bacterium]|nr:zinc/manganese transport system permease protein [Abditibacteriota bacterium]